MPFTLAHSAAALPFRRLPLVTSALVIGTFAPDFEYFLRLAPDRGFGHTIAGTFELTLPVALLILWIFHVLVKRPAAALMPEEIQFRLAEYLGEFRFAGAGRFALIVLSILIGIATHLLWDSFTHRGTWAYRRWPLLQHLVHIPVLGMIPYYKLFQHGSTIAGTGIIVIWLANWYRTTKPSSERVSVPVTATRRGIVIGIGVVAFFGAVLRALVGIHFLTGRLAYSKFAGEAAATFIALAWWQVVLYGLLCSRSRLSRSRGGSVGS